MARIQSTQREFLRSPELLRRRRRRRIFRFIFIVVPLVIVVVGCIVVVRLSSLSIQNVDIHGNQVIDSKDVLKVVNVDIDGLYFYIVPKKNIIFFPRKKIVEDILNNFKRIYSVDVTRKSLTSIDVSILERKPVALWCVGETPKSVSSGLVTSTTSPSSTVSTSSFKATIGATTTKSVQPIILTTVPSEQCYFMDVTGYIFSDAPDFSGITYPIYTGSVDPSQVLGSQYLSPELFAKLQKTTNDLSALGFKMSFVKSEGVDFQFVSTDQLVITMNSRQPFTTSLDTLQTILQNHSFSEFTSIDLRFGNKVFYHNR